MSKAFFKFPRLASVLSLGLALVLAMAAAVPSLGRDDIPELPMPDGSNDTPEMLIKMADDSTLKLSSLRGRVVLLDFFWTKCPHCRDHAPHMVEMYNQYSKRGLVIVGLAAQVDTPEDVKGFVHELKVNYPVGFTTTELLAYYRDSHNAGVPQMVLFGADGKMVKRLIGWNEATGKEIHDAVAAQVQKMHPVKPGSKATSRATARRTAHA